MPRFRYGFPGKNVSPPRPHASVISSPKNTTRSTPGAGGRISVFSLPYRVRPPQSCSNRCWLSLSADCGADSNIRPTRIPVSIGGIYLSYLLGNTEAVQISVERVDIDPSVGDRETAP